MQRYILIVDIDAWGEDESYCVYYSASNGGAASDYAKSWMHKRFSDDPTQTVMSHVIYHVREVADA